MDVRGAATLTEGFLLGLETLHRAGDCEIDSNEYYIMVSANLGVNNLVVGYTGAVSFMDYAKEIVVSADIEYVNSTIGVSYRTFVKTSHD